MTSPTFAKQLIAIPFVQWRSQWTSRGLGKAHLYLNGAGVSECNRAAMKDSGVSYPSKYYTMDACDHCVSRAATLGLIK